MKSYVYLLSLLAFFALSDTADIDQILEVNDNNIILSESSQENVDNLSDEKDSLLAEWKVVVKQVEGLKIYNAQKRQQIKAQEERLVTLAEQTRQVVVIHRRLSSRAPFGKRTSTQLPRSGSVDKHGDFGRGSRWTDRRSANATRQDDYHPRSGDGGGCRDGR